MQQLTCNIDLSNYFYYLFFSFVLIELKPFVLKGKVLGEKILKKCENYETILPFSCCPFSFSLINRPKGIGVTPKYHERKRNPNQNFRGRISSGRVGVFHLKGWRPKGSVCPSKPRENKLFGRDIPGILPGYPGGCPQSLRRKSLCSIFVP